MKTLFVSTVFGFANKGDWELFNSLKRTIEESYGPCKFYGVCKNASIQATKIKGVEWIEQMGSSNKKGIRRMLNIISGYCTALYLLLFYPISNHKYVKALKNSDIIIACPGGYLHDANYSIVTLIFNFLLCLRSKKKLIYAPQSIGPIYNPIFRKCIAYILKKADAIFTREKYSYEYCISDLAIPPEKVRTLMDMAFYFNTTSIPKLQNPLPSNYVATTLIHWLYPKEEKPGHKYHQYLTAIAKAFEHIVLTSNNDIIILKQIEDFGEDRGDDILFDEIDSYINPIIKHRIHYIHEFLSPDEMRGIISKANYFIGSRMHSNIFALSCNTPVIAISYQPKTAYIMQSLGLSKYVINIEHIDSKTLCSLCNEMGNYPNVADKINLLRNDSKTTFISTLKQTLSE